MDVGDSDGRETFSLTWAGVLLFDRMGTPYPLLLHLFNESDKTEVAAASSTKPEAAGAQES